MNEFYSKSAKVVEKPVGTKVSEEAYARLRELARVAPGKKVSDVAKYLLDKASSAEMQAEWYKKALAEAGPAKGAKGGRPVKAAVA